MSQNMIESESDYSSNEEENPEYPGSLSTINRLSVFQKLSSLQFSSNPQHTHLVEGKCTKKHLIPQTINEMAVECQKRAEKTTASRRFKNINLWASYFTNLTPSDESSQIAQTLRHIAMTNEFPCPEDIDGIDLKALYGMLAEAFEGKPFEAVEGITKDFLDEVFNDLMADAKATHSSLTNEIIKKSVEDLSLTHYENKLCLFKF